MILAQAIVAARTSRLYRACVRQLSELSDSELADIGMTRSGIHWVAWRSSVGDTKGKPPVHASNVHED